MVIQPQFLPQLLAYEDEEAKRIVRNLKKVKISNEYQLVNLGVTEYVSIAKLDQKAFRYVEKNGNLYLRESVYSVGGLVQDSVLINLGEFTIGDDETGVGLEYLARVKDAKAKQRRKQLQECERLALRTVQKIHKQVKNAEVLQNWQKDLAANKLFVRLGKEDYYQSQIALIQDYAKQDETLAKILVEYQTKLNEKNEKWLHEPLKLPKSKNPAERIGTKGHEDIGTIDPKRREEFQKYYGERAPQMSAFLDSEEEVAGELPVPPEIVYDKTDAAVTAAGAGAIKKDAVHELKQAQNMAAVQRLKRVFTANRTSTTNVVKPTPGQNQADDTELSR